MIDIEHFNFIKRKYGKTSSWAIWAKQGRTPKSNIGNMNVLNPELNSELLQLLNPNVVITGLNLSGWSENAHAFANFHSSSSSAQDYKIRHALENTDYWGAYMTDVIKNHIEVNSETLMNHLRNSHAEVKQHIKNFQAELSDVCCACPVILAFGISAYKLLQQHLPKNNYLKLIRITHYSHYIGADKYREQVHNQILEAR